MVISLPMTIQSLSTDRKEVLSIWGISVRASLWRETAVFVMIIQEGPNSPPPPLYLCTYPRLLFPAVIAIWRWWIRDQVEVASVEVVRPGRRSHGDRSKDRVPLPSSPAPPITSAFFLSLLLSTTNNNWRSPQTKQHHWSWSAQGRVIHHQQAFVTRNSILRMKLLILCFSFLFPHIIL